MVIHFACLCVQLLDGILYALCFPYPTSYPTNRSISVTGAATLSRKRWDSYAPTAAAISLDVEQLQSEFTAPGVSFSSIGPECVVKMALEDGSLAKLMLPSGLITSFKPLMWHGGTAELLHTTVSAGKDANGVIRGGLSLSLDCKNDAGISWRPDSWTLSQVSGDPQESVQVELISRNGGWNAEVKHIITLGQDVLASEILVSNSNSSALNLKGSILCHLTMSTPDAAYALGLQGSDFSVRPPFETNFSIIPPGSPEKGDQDQGGFWGLNELFSTESKSDTRELSRVAEEQELDGEEEDNYKHLSEEFSRVYLNAPTKLTIMDRGRRNSVLLRREGFEELYMMSPGSEHEMYGEYSFICIGHAASLEPILVTAGSQWQGGLMLFNPNS